MKKIILFSLFLILGLFFSQWLPLQIELSSLKQLHTISNSLLYICLGFIMINVGREFEIDKTKIKSYTVDYFVAMATAALPWILICLYFIFVLMPPLHWGNWDAWKESLLLSRFSAPTSAGILFTMLAAAGLKNQWIYKKTQVLAIFDDLDTILLMIPLQIFMVGMRWQLLVIVMVVVLLLWIGWKRMGSYTIPQAWHWILIYSSLIYALTMGIYQSSFHYFGEEGSIHIEVLLPTFILGMILKHKHNESKSELRASNFISFLFMFLVGLSMPRFFGVDFEAMEHCGKTLTGSMPSLPWGEIALHVIAVTILSNLGKMVPLFFYRDRKLLERLALSVGMFTRGEVGAGVIFISIGYGLGGPALVISVLTIAVNLILTGFFVTFVKKLSLKIYGN